MTITEIESCVANGSGFGAAEACGPGRECVDGACREEDVDAGARDAGPHDAGGFDAGPADAGGFDAGPPDAGGPVTHYALSFDGDGDEVEYPMDFGDLGTRFTFEAWIRPTALTHAYDVGGVVFTHRADCRDFLLEYSRADDGRFSWLVYPASGCGSQVQIVASSVSTPGVWHHVAGVFEDGAMRLYVNGVLEASGTQPMSISWSLGLLGHWTGRDGYDARPDRGALFGEIDEIRVSNSARYTGASFTPPVHFAADATTAGLWLFDEGTGAVANDTSSSGFHGVVRNAGWVLSTR